MTLRFPIDLNEIESTSWPNWFMYEVYQPLILVNDTALYNTGVIESVPALAYNWTTPDNQTWTLNLLQNVTFSNGDPFNATRHGSNRILCIIFSATARRSSGAIRSGT